LLTDFAYQLSTFFPIIEIDVLVGSGEPGSVGRRFAGVLELPLNGN